MSICSLIFRGRKASPLSLTHYRPLSVNSSSLAVLHGRRASLINPTKFQRQPLLHPSSIPSTSFFVPHRLLSTMAPSASVSSPSPEWPARRVRETFLEYFKKNGHTIGSFSTPLLFSGCLLPPCPQQLMLGQCENSVFVLRRASI